MLTRFCTQQTAVVFGLLGGILVIHRGVARKTCFPYSLPGIPCHVCVTHPTTLEGCTVSVLGSRCPSAWPSICWNPWWTTCTRMTRMVVETCHRRSSRRSSGRQQGVSTKDANTCVMSTVMSVLCPTAGRHAGTRAPSVARVKAAWVRSGPVRGPTTEGG